VSESRTTAKQVLAALFRIGWTNRRPIGKHQLLNRGEWPDYIFAFQDREEVGPRMLARITRKTGLLPEDL